MSNLELFSIPLCPFAHRVRLVLAEKEIDYRLTEIDLGNKPQASRIGKRHLTVDAGPTRRP